MWSYTRKCENKLINIEKEYKNPSAVNDNQEQKCSSEDTDRSHRAGKFCMMVYVRSYKQTEGKHMDKKEQEWLNEKKNHDKFNSITQSVKPENQNQEHNVRQEGIGPINQKR